MSIWDELVNLVKKFEITRKKVDIFYYSQFRVEASSKALGDSGCAQGCLDLGGRTETQAQVDLITRWYIEVSGIDGPCGSQSPSVVHFT